MGVMAAQETIGARIAMRRHVLGWTQSGLAARLGVHKDTVVSWETGKHYPRRKLGLLEEVLGVDLLSEQETSSFVTPDEAAIWALTRFSEDERRALIRALREVRGQLTRRAVPGTLRNCAVNPCAVHRVFTWRCS